MPERASDHKRSKDKQGKQQMRGSTPLAARLRLLPRLAATNSLEAPIDLAAFAPPLLKHRQPILARERIYRLHTCDGFLH